MFPLIKLLKNAVLPQLLPEFYCNPDLGIVNSKLIQIGGVAKRPKATVCKTVIRRFESGRRLLFLYHSNKELSEQLIRNVIKVSYPEILNFLELLITTERIIYYRTEPDQAEFSSPSPPLGLLLYIYNQ